MVFVPLINLKIVTCSWPSAQVHFTIHPLKLPRTLTVNVNTLIYVCTRVACLVINVHYYLLYILLFLFLCFFQVSWCAQVFNEPGSVLCTLITQTLTHLEPSLSSCINEFITKESNIIEKLIELRRVRTFSIQLLA